MDFISFKGRHSVWCIIGISQLTRELPWSICPVPRAPGSQWNKYKAWLTVLQELTVCLGVTKQTCERTTEQSCVKQRAFDCNGNCEQSTTSMGRDTGGKNQMMQKAGLDERQALSRKWSKVQGQEYTGCAEGQWGRRWGLKSIATLPHLDTQFFFFNSS